MQTYQSSDFRRKKAAAVDINGNCFNITANFFDMQKGHKEWPEGVFRVGNTELSIQQIDGRKLPKIEAKFDINDLENFKEIEMLKLE